MPILPLAHATNVGRILIAKLSLEQAVGEDCATFGGRAIQDLALRRRVERELWYLHVFGIDYALHHVGGTERARRAALEAFYLRLDLVMDAARHSTNELLRRSELYTKAVESAGPEEPPWSVGRAFAQVCRAPDCVITRTLGKERFCSALVEVSVATKRACGDDWNPFPEPP